MKKNGPSVSQLPIFLGIIAIFVCWFSENEGAALASDTVLLGTAVI